MEIQVRSHVARDLLQAADLFKTDKAVVWEYVSNGLQYVDPGTKPIVHVELQGRKHFISISDNGRGMLAEGLQNFFIMHGENLDRRQGRPGRGNFGTGKSAAFGIAEGLLIRTVRNGKRSIVELRRSDIEAMSSEAPIPVKTHEEEVSTTEANGTTVEISNVRLKSIDQAAIIRFIERHLARWPRDVSVFVNNHQCEFTEPPIERELTFLPDEETKKELGEVSLTIKIAKSPLEEDLRGVAIFSKGVWCETTLAGADGREMSHYIFGEIDMPALDDFKGPNRPIDMSRSMKLNPNNPLVQRVYAFLGEKIEGVRRELVRRDREKRAGEELKRLQVEAEHIADAINEDFEEFRNRLARVNAKSTGGSDNATVPGTTDSVELLAPGGDSLGKMTMEWPNSMTPEQHTNGIPNVDHGIGTPQKENAVESAEDGSPLGMPSDRKRSERIRKTGGFHVRFDNLGAEDYRAKYVRDERTIYINLDHPQLRAARGNTAHEDAGFRRLAYEVAFTEYAVSLAQDKAAMDEYTDFSDPMVDIRDTLNRLATRRAALYAIDTV